MKKLAESKKYVINYEYEKVFLDVKDDHRRVLIGEFYGDPYIAIIAENEKYCAIGGEGVIVYYLEEPFNEYKSDDVLSDQYMIWGRGNSENTIWVESIKQVSENQIKIITEDTQSVIINV